MTDPNGQAPEGQPTTAASGPAPTAPPPSQPPPAAPTVPTPDDGGEDTDPRIQRANKQAAEYRVRAKEAADKATAMEAELTKLKQASMSDQERKDAEFKAAQERANALDQTARTLEERATKAEHRLAIYEAADTLRTADKPLQFHNLSTVMKLIDAADLTPGADGTAPNLEAVLRTLAKQHPYLVAQPTTPGYTASPGNPASSRTPANGTPTTLEDFRGKSPEFINAHWDTWKQLQLANRSPQ